MKPASLLVAILLDVIAVVHILRLVFRTEVIIGGWVLPMWVSGVGAVAATVLSVLVFREARSAREA
jgi:multidrug transporter EmrE-like cation transporter